jgi:hypothetical protein
MCKELGLETLKARRAKQDLMLANKFVCGVIAGGDHLFRKTDESDRVRTQAKNSNSLVAQYARTDNRKFSFGVRVVEPRNKLSQIHVTSPRKEKSRPKSRQLKSLISGRTTLDDNDNRVKYGCLL